MRYKYNCQNRSNCQLPPLYAVLRFSYRFYGRLVFRVFRTGDRYGSWSNRLAGFWLPVTLIRSQYACFNCGSRWLIIHATSGCKIKLMVCHFMPDCLPLIIHCAECLMENHLSADAQIFDENKSCRVSIYVARAQIWTLDTDSDNNLKSDIIQCIHRSWCRVGVGHRCMSVLHRLVLPCQREIFYFLL